MTNPYIAQDVLDQCQDALRQGRTLEQLAGQLRCDTDHLAGLMRLPTVKPVPTQADASCDLWAVDRLADVL